MATVTESVKEGLLGKTQPADLSNEARNSFLQYAQQGEDSESYMDKDGFIDAIAPEGEDYHKIQREQYGVLFAVADRNQKGKVTMSDWASFQNLLTKSDAEYEIAFRLFDTEGKGLVKSGDIQRIYEENRNPDGIPFNFGSDWATLYFGGANRRHEITYEQFAQMMRGLVGERIRQAFRVYDKDNDGFIDPEQFEQLVRSTVSHKLSDHILDNLTTLCNLYKGSKISYANVRAFQNVVREMDFLDAIIEVATKTTKDRRIDRREFLEAAARHTRFLQYTPMEADILFHFASIDVQSDRLAFVDFQKVFDPSYQISESSSASDEAKTATQKFLAGLAESAHHFGLGAIAGAFGAFMVYPIDLVKTRMQNQRSTRPGERLYLNSIDCFRKVVRNEGFRGLYSGVLPQLVGVAPEKAIKLTVNDLVRGRFTDKETGVIVPMAEILSGGTAGACQVVFTNPLEIVKIRLQIQGELAKKSDTPRRSAGWIIQNLGVLGLYRGATACLLRDVPFSAIYFPTYAHLKKDFFGESPQKKLGVLQLLTAGAIAGMPAAYLTTPADVIKTRLQVEARKGDATYNGIVDCARKVYKDEGFRAFFKGGPARILRSSPQFGFTLAAYEVLSKALPMPGSEEAEAQKEALGGRLEPGIGLREARAPLPYLRSRNALKILLDMDPAFGKSRNVPKGVESKGWGFGVSKKDGPSKTE